MEAEAGKQIEERNKNLAEIEERNKQLLTVVDKKIAENMPQPVNLDEIRKEMGSFNVKVSALDKRINSLDRTDSISLVVKPVRERLDGLIEVLNTEFKKLLGSGVKGQEYKTALAVSNALKGLDKEVERE